MGGGGAQRPVWYAVSSKDGCAQRTGAHARPKPTSYKCLLGYDCVCFRFSRVFLKGPKSDIILTELFTQNKPLREDDLGARK